MWCIGVHARDSRCMRAAGFEDSVAHAGAVGNPSGLRRSLTHVCRQTPACDAAKLRGRADQGWIRHETGTWPGGSAKELCTTFKGGLGLCAALSA